ncbi:Isoprenylcysteine carboxyl methyltransferase family-domain-containing protein [Bipolaris maydis]|nr:Isoprenylcysteine carboxyl methyltransferase family-domain-containing protein [Bipolaris maydis]KAJ5026174.1 Isoprenylcysteine carboxyl methyltransferase family-domain-containing protein [Bipolaris maydis]
MASNGAASGIDISLPGNPGNGNAPWAPGTGDRQPPNGAPATQPRNPNTISPDFYPHGKRSLSGIAVRAFCLGCALVLGLAGAALLAYHGSHLWRPCLFLSTLALFHFLEFYTTAAYNTPVAKVASFLLSNGDQYRIAHTMAFIETFVTSYFFPGYQSYIHPPWAIAIGVILIALGQTVRSIAMIQAGTNFNHMVQSSKNDGHELVTHGLYHYFRHPSYFGFFWWGIGTQIMLGNAFCFLAYTAVLWSFFKRRIFHEEKHLLEFFGNDYREYKARTRHCSTTSLPSPLLSPSRAGCRQQTSSPPASRSPTAMYRSRWADPPPTASKGAMSQSAAPSIKPSTPTVQPIANPGALKLKKSAVKILGAASHVPPPSTPSAASIPLPMTPPVSLSDKLEPLVAESFVSVPPMSNAKADSSQKEDSKSDDTSALIDALFARLNSKSPELSAPATSSSMALGNHQQVTPVESLPISAKATPINSSVPTEAASKQATTDILPKPVQAQTQPAGITQAELENEYMRRASAYVDALPDTKKGTPQLIKVVSHKMRVTYKPLTSMDVKEKDAIKARFAFAIANYLNKTLRKGPTECTVSSIKQKLEDVDGDFLRLCAILVEEKHMSLETLDDVTGLLKALLDILPKAELIIVPDMLGSKPVLEDPVDSMKTWPTQEKRDSIAAPRTCILKGVSAVTSINQLQALVWGGRLESISLPEPGSSNALVKFLTADGCKKYHADTVNGVEVGGDKKSAVVFVELADGPNSTNDVIQGCIDNGMTRCVRAIGKVDCTNTQLMELAKGESQVNKREVDCIKHGKNARGHDYIEFRFANIYHALSFRRELMDNEDWEHCNIGYAPDPCELATGVRYKDNE